MPGREARSAGTPLKALRADIESDRLARVYLFYGEESYLMRTFTQAIAKRLLAPGAEALDRVVFDAEGRPTALDLRRVAAETATPPFLSSRKLVLVRNSGLFGMDRKGGGKDGPAVRDAEDDDEVEETSPSGDAAKDRTESLVRLLDGVPDSACLVFLEKKIDRRVKKPLEAVERNGRAVEFATQETEDLRTFVRREFSSAGIGIDDAAVDSILVRTGGSMQTLVLETEKMRLYCKGSGTARVTTALVEDLCIPDLTGKVFDMTDAIGLGRPGDALRILDALIARKEPVQLLLFMLARHVRLLIRAKEIPDRGRLASALGLPPSIAGKYAEQARNFTFEALEELHGRCFEADSAMKTGRLPERAALETLLAGSPSRRSAPRRP